MGDGFIKHAIQTARLAFIFIQFSRFSGRSDQLVEPLRIGLKRIQKGSRVFGFLEQSITPLLGLVMVPLLGVIGVLHRIQLRLQTLRFDAAHDFTDKLHLSTSGFMLFIRNGTVGFKRLTQLVFREFNLSKLLVRQRGQRLAERLKRQHFTFFCTFRRLSVELFVDLIVILKGAFVIHVCEV